MQARETHNKRPSNNRQTPAKISQPTISVFLLVVYLKFTIFCCYQHTYYPQCSTNHSNLDVIKLHDLAAAEMPPSNHTERQPPSRPLKIAEHVSGTALGLEPPYKDASCPTLCCSKNPSCWRNHFNTPLHHESDDPKRRRQTSGLGTTLPHQAPQIHQDPTQPSRGTHFRVYTSMSTPASTRHQAHRHQIPKVSLYPVLRALSPKDAREWNTGSMTINHPRASKDPQLPLLGSRQLIPGSCKPAAYTTNPSTRIRTTSKKSLPAPMATMERRPRSKNSGRGDQPHTPVASTPATALPPPGKLPPPTMHSVHGPRDHQR